MSQRQPRDHQLLSSISPGAWVVLLLAVTSTAAVVLWPVPRREGLEMWTFARDHARMYRDAIALWNEDTPAPDQDVNLYLLSGNAMTQRMMAGFLSDTPLADLLEIERTMACQSFSGPLDDVGFVDLTDRLHEEGIYERINAPSFSPWTSRGRIFGLPHDVHPVALVYRHDIVEAAGIDVSQIETWDDFARVMRPLVQDLDGDGKPDRYPMGLWYTNIGHIEVLMLQAGGGMFDENLQPIIDSQANARVIATVISWMVGPDRIAIDAPPFTASGNFLRMDGRVVCELMADWMAGAWKHDMPGLEGKLRLMPMPAWERGGRRTSVMGGTMLGVAKSSDNFEASWAFAKHLYLDPKLAEALYETNTIISPVREFWDLPFYDKPDPYFGGQPVGRLLIELAPHVPPRISSPYNNLASARVQEAIIGLWQYAESTRTYDADDLMTEASRLLGIAEDQVRKQMQRNVFVEVSAP